MSSPTSESAPVQAPTRSGRSFRTRLAAYLSLFGIVLGAPALFVTVSAPWSELDDLIGEANVVVAAANDRLPLTVRAKLNQVTLARLAEDPAPPDAVSLGRGLALLVQEGQCLDDTALSERLNAYPDAENFDVPAVSAACRAWVSWFEARADGPGELLAFHQADAALASALRTAGRVDLVAGDVYLTLDVPGQPFFERNLAYVATAARWWERPPAPGHAFDLVEVDGEFWRDSYRPERGGSPGFAHNPTHAPLLPRFETDEWGTWFSAWYAPEPTDGHYNTVTVDINAAAVTAMMSRAAFEVVLSLCIGLLLIAVAAGELARWVSQPVAALQNGAQAVIRLDFNHTVPALGDNEFVTLIHTFNQMIRGLRERGNLFQALEKVLSKELAAAAANEGLVLGGQVVPATVLFTDFAGFSTITRGVPATEVVSALNAYFYELVPLIKEHGGFPDKYIGDAIVAIFGAPVRTPDHAERAVRCALAMQRRLRTVNATRRAAGKIVFEMRVGINTGDVMVGAIGCDEKLEFTSIGETTTVANRMESICRIGHVMVAESTWAAIPPERSVSMPHNGPSSLKIKGYDEPVSAVEVYADTLSIERGPSEAGSGDPYRYGQLPTGPAPTR